MSQIGAESAAGFVQYWGSPGTAARILDAVHRRLPGGAAPADLTGLDHVHSGGLLATKALADVAEVERDMEVLDVGACLGGPARWLASQFGCRVTCLDLTPEFCQAAAELTKMTGLTSLVSVVNGDALDTPFDDKHFDLVWAQNAFMNIRDKVRLFRELHRVLKPGGKLVFQEPMAGPNPPLHFPVTWADRPDLSFLVISDGLSRDHRSRRFSGQRLGGHHRLAEPSATATKSARPQLRDLHRRPPTESEQ